ncbi:MAG: hypothetical protein AAF772_05210 [Acidobacteriota bacterium]
MIKRALADALIAQRQRQTLHRSQRDALLITARKLPQLQARLGRMIAP